MKSKEKLHQELRNTILNLPGVIERQNAGIHEDAFFVGGKMFMHIGVDPTVVSPAAISIRAASAVRSCQGRTAHGSKWVDDGT